MEEVQDIAPENNKKEKKRLGKKTKWFFILLLWIGVLAPASLVYFMLSMADDGTLPSFELLENPQSNLASTIFTQDNVELGKYFRENRTTAKYNELSPWLQKALVGTEDERFQEHSGVDVRALGRVIKGVVLGQKSQGGGSTISQQLAKLLFPRKKLTKWELVKRKFKEWIIATRLEKNYTKEEIITMYLNKFDFLNNAVGINSAAQVYFGKTPLELELHEAAMLIGMAKNPSLFNPLKRYDTVQHRRNVVFSQMKKSKFITQETYDSVKVLPLDLNYTRVDHQSGLAPYFRETLRKEVTSILGEKDAEGNYVIIDADGDPYNIYSDGLKVYTTIDSRLQKYAEYAVQEHLKFELQEDFFKNNKRWKNPPFSNDLSLSEIDTLMQRAKRRSKMYKSLIGKICSYCERTQSLHLEGDHYHCDHCDNDTKIHTEKEINEIFNKKRKIRVFDWKSKGYEKDTLLSAMDSIRYYKSLLRASMISINPHNGYIKAWVGGANFKHFKYDMVRNGKRQVGSTFKPFVYATAIEVGAIHPCDQVPDMQYCVEVPYNAKRNKMWCPGNAGARYTNEMTPYSFALASSMNNITAHIIGKDGMPQKVFNRVAELGIDTSMLEPVPSMALGVFDLSVYEMVSGMTAFVNNGVYITPTFILRIEDKNGNVIYEPKHKAKEVWAEKTAYTILQMMKKVTSGMQHPTAKGKNGRKLVGGTAIRIRGRQTEKRPYAGLKMPIAGKTGTTQNQSDGWFMGLTPDLVSGVWVGAEDRSVRFRSLQLGMGTNMALPIWAYYMHKVYNDSTLNISQGDFPTPPSVTQDPLNCFQYEMGQPSIDDYNNEGFDGLNSQGQEQEW
jgi:penicillin-binding protein 1A